VDTLRSIYTYNRTFEVRLPSIQLIIMSDTADALIFETSSLRNNFIKIVA
jgi:hypothetical protein